MSKKEDNNLRGPRVNAEQKEYVIDYMATHAGFAAGRFTVEMGAEQHRRQWSTSAEEANKKEPEKTVQQWRKAWQDIKKRSKGKATAIKDHHNKTGNFPDTSEPLTDMDKKVLSVIGSDAVEGLHGVADSLPGNVSELRKLMAGDHSPLQKVPVAEVSVFQEYDITAVSVVKTPEPKNPNTKTHEPSIVIKEIIEDYTPSTVHTPKTHTPPIPTTSIDTHHTRSPHIKTPPTNQPRNTLQQQTQREKRKIATKRKISDTRTEQFMEIQRKQNQILETMANAMMKSAENEEKRIELAREELELKRQKFEEQRSERLERTRNYRQN